MKPYDRYSDIGAALWLAYETKAQGGSPRRILSGDTVSEMIDRVARALAAEEFSAFPSAAEFIDANWYQFSEELAERYRSKARAAIAAMREPTEVMLFGQDERSRFSADFAAINKEVWQAMIDAALIPSEPSPPAA